MESLVLSPTSAKQGLISNLSVVSASPRNVTFNQLIWNYVISTSEVICTIGPLPPPKKVTLLETIHSLLDTSFFHYLLPIKGFHFAQLLRAPDLPDGM